MKYFFVFILLNSTLSQLYSQEFTYEIPDYDLIKKETHDSANIFYYPKLLSRLTQYDTTLTSDDYRYLYFGYIFQDDYQPYWTSPDEKELMKYYRSETIDEKDHDEIIRLATHSINEFPFDLRQMNFMGYIYHLKGDEEMAKKVSFRFHGIFGAIMSSGDGKTCESAFHVISVSHEYVFLNLFEFQMTSQALTGDCDYLTLVKDERNIEGVYFNIKQMFNKNLEILKHK
jgi:hypothetical protein